MTEMLHAEFEDETGTTRRLTRDEVLTYVNVVAGAGNETTTRLIGWTGKVLSEHPDQRRELVEDRTLIPNAIEELLRYESPAPHVARYVTRDVEYYGQTVPEGSVMMMLIGAANRDDRRFPDGDRFDIHRDGRAAPDLRLRHPLLPRRGPGPPRRAHRARRGARSASRSGRSTSTTPGCHPTSTVRGWETLPVIDSVIERLRDPRRRRGTRRPAPPPGADPLSRTRSTAPAGTTGSRSTTCASSSSTGATTYDWRAQEARLNELAHFRTAIDGQSIHFVHARSPHADARPLLLTHGWPGSIVEFLDVIPRLTDPEDARRTGGRRVPRGRAVITRLRILGAHRTRGWDTWRIARAFVELMRRLGYARYGAQGGDWGAQVTTRIGALDPEHCAAIHLNMPIAEPPEERRPAHRRGQG